MARLGLRHQEVRGERGRPGRRRASTASRPRSRTPRRRSSVHEGRITKNEPDTAAASKTAQQALERAVAAGKLAEGKLLYETVLSDDKVKFGFDKAELSARGQGGARRVRGAAQDREQERLRRDPGPHRQRRRRALQREARQAARRGGRGVPRQAGHSAVPHRVDLLRRVRAGRRQQDPRRPRARTAAWSWSSCSSRRSAARQNRKAALRSRLFHVHRPAPPAARPRSQVAASGSAMT